MADKDEEIGARRLVARSTTVGPSRDVGHEPLLPHPRTSTGRGPFRRSAERTAPTVAWRTRWGLDARRMRTLLVAAAVGLLLLTVIGLALALASQSPAKPAGGAGAARHPSASSRGNGSKGSGTTPAHVSAGGTSPTSTSAPAPAPTGAPRLVSASPRSGGAGQTVVIDGSGLFSSNGEVQAYFGGTAAPTSCATQTSCTVTVPDLGTGSSTVQLAVVTAGGRSNVLAFRYA